MPSNDATTNVIIPEEYGKPEGLRTLANYLRSGNGVKVRSGIQYDKRVDYFKGKDYEGRLQNIFNFTTKCRSFTFLFIVSLYCRIISDISRKILNIFSFYSTLHKVVSC